MPSITFDFFGTQVRVHVPTVDDALHLCRYYRDYRIADHSCVSPMFEVRLLAADGISFIEALLSRSILKSIWLRRYGGEWELYETFSHKPSKVTPIPPLLLRQDASFSLTHASAFGVTEATGTNRAVVVRGDSGSGKSTILMRAMEAGASFISDDMTWVRCGHVHPFTRPIGIRSGLARSLDTSVLKCCQRHGVRLETNGELTYMVHPRDLGLLVLDHAVAPTATVQLMRSDTIELIEDPELPGRFTLMWNPRTDGERGWDELAKALKTRGITP